MTGDLDDSADLDFESVEYLTTNQRNHVMSAPGTKYLSSTLLIVFLLTLGLNPGTAATLRFENDQDGWEAAASAKGELNAIDFDMIASDTILVGDEFSSLPAAPTFSSIFAFDGTGPYVASHDFALSVPNVLRPTNSSSLNDGVVRVTFDTPIHSMGASFFDVEADLRATGFGLGSQTVTPDIAFSTQLSDAYQFLGFVSDVGVSTVDIYFAAAPGNELGIDGTFLDDLQYANVPEPSAAILLAIGLSALARRRDQKPNS